MRNITDADLVGKTIQSIANQYINSLELIFTDGTSLTLWAEDTATTSFGSIPGILVEEE